MGPGVKALRRDGLDRAAAYVETHATPLDRALGRHHLLGGDRQEVIDALAELQNPDGGFAGMEADFPEESSAVVSTLRALQILEELDVAAGHPMVARAIAGLAADYEPAWRSWRLIRQHDNARPHAPWWHWTDDFDERWGHYADNPRPAVVACLHRFASGVAPTFLDELTRTVVRRAGELDPGGVHNNATECYHRFACSPAVPAAARAAVAERLTEIIDATLITEPARWRTYGLQPLTSLTARRRHSMIGIAIMWNGISTTSSTRRERMEPGRRIGAGRARSRRRGNARRSPGRGV